MAKAERWGIVKITDAYFVVCYFLFKSIVILKNL